MTNSSCYSPITLSSASWLTVVCAYDPATSEMKVVPGASGEARSANKDHCEDMFVWFRTLMRDPYARGRDPRARLIGVNRGGPAGR